MYKAVFATLALTLVLGAPAFARCACLGPEAPDEDYGVKAADNARKLPSEADRQLARNMRAKGLAADAAPYYKSAASKAASEVENAKAELKSAQDLEQTALHSAAVHREVASYFNTLGQAADAALNWESAINDELIAHKVNHDLATEYGTVARLYEQAHDFGKAAAMYKKQGDALAALHGRYDHNAQFAYNEFSRLSKKLKAAI